MNRYHQQADLLKQHLREHPTDYQASIALLKKRSAGYEHELKQERIKGKKEVARIRRLMEDGE